MTKGKITAGRWQATFDVLSVVAFPPSGEATVVCLTGYKGLSTEERQANTRLFSAAKELLLLACELIATAPPEDHDDPVYRRACDIVQAVTQCGDAQVYDTAMRLVQELGPECKL